MQIALSKRGGGACHAVRQGLYLVRDCGSHIEVCKSKNIRAISVVDIVRY
jgi:hypothetical protein